MWEVFFELKCKEFTRLCLVFTKRGFDVVGFVPPSKISIDEPPWYWTNENKTNAVRTSFRGVTINAVDHLHGLGVAHECCRYEWNLLNALEELTVEEQSFYTVCA